MSFSSCMKLIERFGIVGNLIGLKVVTLKIERVKQTSVGNAINANYYRCCMPFNLGRFIFTLTSSLWCFLNRRPDSSYFERQGIISKIHTCQKNAEFDGGCGTNEIKAVFHKEKTAEDQNNKQFFFFFFLLVYKAHLFWHSYSFNWDCDICIFNDLRPRRGNLLIA